MFTGIVEYMGSVVEAVHGPDGSRVIVDVGPLEELEVGDSVAVNGVCLTVTKAGSHVAMDVVPETLKRSNLFSLEAGDPVNLERAMPAAGRFSGHIVQGHVDGVGKVIESLADLDEGRMTIEIPPDLTRYVVAKGSITVDGVSLTVASIDGSKIELAIIPHTREVTTLGLRKEGDPVNLEVDVLAKYVEKLLEHE